MAARYGQSEDAVYYDFRAPCCGPDEHRRCLGSWRGVVSLGHGPDGKRNPSQGVRPDQTEVRDKLQDLHRDIESGVRKAAGGNRPGCGEERPHR